MLIRTIKEVGCPRDILDRDVKQKTRTGNGRVQGVEAGATESRIAHRIGNIRELLSEGKRQSRRNEKDRSEH